MSRYYLRRTNERVARETADMLAFEQGRNVALEQLVEERGRELAEVRHRLDQVEAATKGFFGERIRYEKTIKVFLSFVLPLEPIFLNVFYSYLLRLTGFNHY